LFHPEYAGLGECGTERSDSDLIVHMDMSEKEGFYFVEHFSFASLEGECVFFYNPPEDVPEDVRYSHEYTYNWADIAGMDNFSSEANKDMSSKLVGVWATEEYESTYTAPDGQLWGCMVRYFYVFYSDGTWSWAEIMDSRDDSGYHSVEDNFKKWYAGNKAASDHTYYFDGNEMKFKPDNDQDRNVTEASLEGKTLKLHVDYGRYLDQENTQSGSYNFYSGL
nr:hypothetical protein [Lachnospiraceae bacterium]